MKSSSSGDFKPALWHLAVFAAFVVTLGLAAFIPIYTDEVSWKIMQARLMIDGGTNITLYPYCGASFAMAPPWFMLPARWFDAWLYADLDPPIRLRLLGLAHLLAWVALLSWLLPRALAFEMRRMTAASIVVSFICLGVLPLLMVINRPEQQLLFCLTIVFFQPFLARESDTIGTQCTRGLVLVGAVAIACSYHPKVLAFLPLILASGYFSLKNWAIRFLAAVMLGYLVSGTYTYWSTHMACPEYPAMLSALGKHGGLVSLSDIVSAPIDTAALLFRNVVRLSQYPYFMLFYSQDQLELFVPANTSVSSGAILIDVLVVGLGVVMLGMFGYATYWAYRRNGARDAVNRDWVRLIVSGAVVVSIVGLSALQTHKNFYETSLVVPLMALALFASLHKDTAVRWPVAIRRLTSALVGLSLISQFALWGEFAHYAKAVGPQGPYIVGLWGAFSPLNYERVRADVLETARLCGISSDQSVQHLVVDDVTYTVFATSYQPYHLMYLSRDLTSGSGRNTKALEEFLRSRKSAGIIAGCHWFPRGLSDRLVKNGDFCCIQAFSP